MKPPKKWERVLAALLEGRSYNRFEAERDLSDHCLHSTIASIEAKGVPVSRRFESVPGYAGSQTKCCRYWLDPKNFAAARILLDGGDPRDPASLVLALDEGPDSAITDLLEGFGDASADQAIADLLATFGTAETADKVLADWLGVD
jgi:hypothetical protein